ncbi:hypothetical protein EF294_17150 [Gordonia oryzae]|uniref:Tetracyclin repressor-like C-terminal domain-containing protein n=2 Tax=Gordonia oryzae TaxID=2487349 RepID=A0A3N4G8X6_9ACTN|nr:hypothetical protein EF294_17150 [Gordonia oryzae]
MMFGEQSGFALGGAARDDHRARRPAVIAFQMFGLLLLRIVIQRPEIVVADRGERVAQVGPVIIDHLRGDFTCALRR